MPDVRSKSKVEIGGYFDCELVEEVQRQAKSRGITVTDFVIEAYSAGLDRDMPGWRSKKPPCSKQNPGC